MKKIVIVSIVMFCLSGVSYGQYVFSKGDLDLNLGIGLKENIFPRNDLILGVPPLTLGLDYALEEGYGPGVIAIGALVGFTSFKEEKVIANVKSGYKYSGLFMGARGTYHIELMDKLDVYGGLTFYYLNPDANAYGVDLGENPLDGRFGVALTAGMKYFFTEKLATFAEVGYNLTVFNVGVTFRLK